MKNDNNNKKASAKILGFLINIFNPRKQKVSEPSKEEMAKKMEKQAKELKKIKANQKKMQNLAKKNETLARRKKAQENRRIGYEKGKKTGIAAGQEFANNVEKLFKGGKPTRKSGIRR